MDFHSISIHRHFRVSVIFTLSSIFLFRVVLHLDLIRVFLYNIGRGGKFTSESKRRKSGSVSTILFYFLV